MITETTQQIAINEVVLKVIALLQNAVSQTAKGVTFFGLRNYQNKQLETSNYLINLGIDYEDQKNKDIQYLRTLDITKQTFNSPLTLIEQARQELINSFIAPDENRSNGQKNAFTHICKGLKIHNESGLLYIYGYLVNKTVITKGEPKKAVNSRPLTIAKDELRKELKTGKFVSFIVSVGNTIKVSGETLEIDL
jgi:hypothetical protein